MFSAAIKCSRQKKKGEKKTKQKNIQFTSLCVNSFIHEITILPADSCYTVPTKSSQGYWDVMKVGQTVG